MVNCWLLSMECQLMRSISMILPSLAKYQIISPVWRECRAKVERNPSNACNLVVCSCSLPWLTYWCDRSALPDPTVGRSAINLVYCRSPVKRKRFNDRSPLRSIAFESLLHHEDSQMHRTLQFLVSRLCVLFKLEPESAPKLPLI